MERRPPPAEVIPNKKPPRLCIEAVQAKRVMGLEPMTPCLGSKCSTD